MNTNKYHATDIHESLTNVRVETDYIPGKIGFIRHIRHFNSDLRKRCTENRMMTLQKCNKEEIITKKSKNIYGTVFGKSI